MTDEAIYILLLLLNCWPSNIVTEAERLCCKIISSQARWSASLWIGTASCCPQNQWLGILSRWPSSSPWWAPLPPFASLLPFAVCIRDLSLKHKSASGSEPAWQDHCINPMQKRLLLEPSIIKQESCDITKFQFNHIWSFLIIHIASGEPKYLSSLSSYLQSNTGLSVWTGKYQYGWNVQAKTEMMRQTSPS